MDRKQIDDAINEIDSFILKETGIDLKFLTQQKQAKDAALKTIFNGLISNTKKFENRVLSSKAFKEIL